MSGGETCNKRRFDHIDRRQKKKKKHGKYKAFNKMVEINPRKLIVTTFVNRTKSLMKE